MNSFDVQGIGRRDLLRAASLGVVALGLCGVWGGSAVGASPDEKPAVTEPGDEVPITLDEVKDFATRWFSTVMNGGSAAEQAAYFLDPNSRIQILEIGVAYSFEEHHKLHAQWIDEVHRLGPFVLTTLNTSPPRVRAIGTVYWEAELPGRPPPNVIKAVVGEDWIIERRPSGELAFVLYMNTFHHTLPDSAPLGL